MIYIVPTGYEFKPSVKLSKKCVKQFRKKLNLVNYLYRRKRLGYELPDT
jgi:hypothetical protein